MQNLLMKMSLLVDHEKAQSLLFKTKFFVPIANVQKPRTDLGGAGHVNASGGLILALHGCVERLKKHYF